MVFAVTNECIMNITHYIPLVKYVLLKIQLNTIKLIEIKIGARSNLYQENTKHVITSPIERTEELNKKVKETTKAVETLI